MEGDSSVGGGEDGMQSQCVWVRQNSKEKCKAFSQRFAN